MTVNISNHRVLLNGKSIPRRPTLRDLIRALEVNPTKSKWAAEIEWGTHYFIPEGISVHTKSNDDDAPIEYISFSRSGTHIEHAGRGERWPECNHQIIFNGQTIPKDFFSLPEERKFDWIKKGGYQSETGRYTKWPAHNEINFKKLFDAFSSSTRMVSISLVTNVRGKPESCALYSWNQTEDNDRHDFCFNPPQESNYTSFKISGDACEAHVSIHFLGTSAAEPPVSDSLKSNLDYSPSQTKPNYIRKGIAERVGAMVADTIVRVVSTILAIVAIVALVYLFLIR